MNRNQLFEKVFKAKYQNKYWNSIFELRKFADQEMIDKCLSLINTDDDKLKMIGIDILSQLGTNREDFVNILLEKIFEILQNSDNEKLISSCLLAIGHNNKKVYSKQLKILEKFKFSKSKEIRYYLVFSVLAKKNKIAVDILMKLSNDKSPKVRDWAVFGLGELINLDNQQIRKILFERSFDKDDQTKQEAIKGLANRKDERVTKIIFDELKSENFGSLLFDTILNLENRILFLPELEKIFRNSQNDSYINEDWKKDLEFLINELKN